MSLIVVCLVAVGLGTVIWSTVGVIRVVAGRFASSTPPPPHRLRSRDVAVLIAAHDEELVIEHTIRSAAALVATEQVFVVSDGSHDETVAIAEAAGATVLDLHPNRGKAGAIEAAIEALGLAKRFKVVMLLDADTQLADDYFETGLPLFDDADVVAVAGRATTLRERAGASVLARAIVDHRERVYVLVQFLHKFGQAARGVNAVSIVPGFASMYRSRVLADIDIAAKGLAIEDYNMTFEIHAKRLGRIAFHPHAAVAFTQDPVMFRDYIAQVSRWNLGFWQTVRRHGAHIGVFWAALGFSIAELVFSSLLLVIIAPVLIALTAFAVVDAVDGPATTTASIIVGAAPPLVLLLALLIPDLVMTGIAVLLTGNPSMLRSAGWFPLLRVLDAMLCLRALARAARSPTTGAWTSPTRRAVDAVAAHATATSTAR